MTNDHPFWPGGWRGWLITAALVVAAALICLRWCA